ncbi:MAG: metal-activated pyridoxal enzyme [Melioribacteraceae bacterium]|nr:MAG: metal-activated pyridoxal enzyme [Melioribacteraceae bacterium]
MLDVIEKYKLSTPFLLLNTGRVLNNINEFKTKAEQNNLVFRPHFKTHRSVDVGKLFLNEGIDKITVSSVRMATYFASFGWKDILIAFPVNFPEMKEINKLASELQLSLLVDNSLSAQYLVNQLSAKVDVYVKINTGYNRAGIHFQDDEELKKTIEILLNNKNIRSVSLLTHNGETYVCDGRNCINSIHKKSVDKIVAVKKMLLNHYGLDFAVSIGDTPGCRVSSYFDGVDEIRPGNFVFYDWMQYRFSICSLKEISLKLIAPVVSVQKNPSRILLYAGAVHLGKDYVEYEGNKEFGAVKLSGTYFPINRLSQEHAIVEVPKEILCVVSPGDRVEIIPAHSCLSADMYKKYYSTDGKVFQAMEKHFGE